MNYFHINRGSYIQGVPKAENTIPDSMRKPRDFHDFLDVDITSSNDVITTSGCSSKSRDIHVDHVVSRHQGDMISTNLPMRGSALFAPYRGLLPFLQNN
jgi:hypothetical protein